MKKHKTLIIVLAIIAGLIILVSLGRLTNKPEKIFFYGDTCVHCKNVETYMNENGTRNKLKFQELEVFNNQDNAQYLAQVSKQCGLDLTNGIQVPVFYDGKTCLLGDEPIINYLKQQ